MSTVLKCVALLTAVLLSGCATRERVPELSQYPGVQLEKNDKWGYEYVEGVTYAYSGKTKGGKDALPLCIAQNVQNKSIVLTGSKNAMLGAVVQTSTQTAVGGGNVISYVSDDKNSVVAEGSIALDAGFVLAPTKDNITFRLNAKRSQAGLSLVFSNLERASSDTGTMANQGFYKIGTWSGADPIKVLNSLKKTADTINTCLSSM